MLSTEIVAKERRGEVDITAPGAVDESLEVDQVLRTSAVPDEGVNDVLVPLTSDRQRLWRGALHDRLGELDQVLGLAQ
jgi:hypothetical protein